MFDEDKDRLEYLWRYWKIQTIITYFPSSFIMAIAVALAYGWSWILFGRLWITLMFNILGIPFLFIFNYPLWIIYIIVIYWIGGLIDFIYYRELNGKVKKSIGVD